MPGPVRDTPARKGNLTRFEFGNPAGIGYSAIGIEGQHADNGRRHTMRGSLSSAARGMYIQRMLGREPSPAELRKGVRSLPGTDLQLVVARNRHADLRRMVHGHSPRDAGN